MLDTRFPEDSQERGVGQHSYITTPNSAGVYNSFNHLLLTVHSEMLIGDCYFGTLIDFPRARRREQRLAQSVWRLKPIAVGG